MRSIRGRETEGMGKSEETAFKDVFAERDGAEIQTGASAEGHGIPTARNVSFLNGTAEV